MFLFTVHDNPHLVIVAMCLPFQGRGNGNYVVPLHRLQGNLFEMACELITLPSSFLCNGFFVIELTKWALCWLQLRLSTA